MMPLGRYLTRKLRKRFGLEEVTPQAVLQAWQEELSPLLESAFALSREEGIPVDDVIARDRRQDLLNAESRHKIFNSRSKL